MKILVLPGDGIGPEITEATLAVLDRANAKFKLGLEWQREEIGLGPLKKRGSTLPEDVMEAARQAPGIILGPVDHLQYPPREQGGINPSGEFRVKLDLFANIRPADNSDLDGHRLPHRHQFGVIGQNVQHAIGDHGRKRNAVGQFDLAKRLAGVGRNCQCFAEA